jgi:hypothetical protein
VQGLVSSQSSGLQEAPRVAPADIDQLVTTSDFVPKTNALANSIVKEIEKRSSLDRENEAELLDAALKASEARKETEKNLSATNAMPKIAAVEQFSLKTLIVKTIGTMTDQVARQRLTYEALKEELKMILSDGNELLLESSDEKLSIFAGVLPAVQEYLTALSVTWTEWANFTRTGEEYFAYRLDLAKVAKEFNDGHCDTFNEVKSALKQIREFKDVAKKEIAKKEKEEVRKNARRDAGPTIHAAKLISAMKAYLNSSGGDKLARVNMKWVLGEDLLRSASPSAVVIPAERATQAASAICKMEYFTQQQTWVKQIMKEQGLQIGAAVITKPQIQKSIVKLIATMSKEISCEPFGTYEGELQDIMSPQFYQVLPDTCHISTGNDFGLIDCKLTLEGEEFIYGVLLSEIPGSTMLEKQKTLSDYGSDVFLCLVKRCGFFFHATPNTCIIVPGGFALVSRVEPGKHVHGLRWQLFGSDLRRKDSLAYLQLLTAGGVPVTSSAKAVADFLTPAAE